MSHNQPGFLCKYANLLALLVNPMLLRVIASHEPTQDTSILNLATSQNNTVLKLNGALRGAFLNTYIIVHEETTRTHGLEWGIVWWQ
jgi:hypothetical protein